LDLLLFNFLQEFVYYKDAELLLLRVEQVEIITGASCYGLTATVRGERLDPDRHHPRVDVKAVTLHRFSLQQGEHGWEASVILDI
jgi:SHS2 domain-containing protein